MIAPRKKLWSTPREALEMALSFLSIHEADIVYDIGCGDGNFLELAAKSCESMRFSLKGIEIEPERAADAESRVRPLCSSISLTIINANALEVDYTDGTCFFMYLIPRGLRLIMPLLSGIRHPIRIVTFMNPFPNIEPTRTAKVESKQHADSQWPLFYYEVTDPSLIFAKKDHSNSESV